MADQHFPHSVKSRKPADDIRERAERVVQALHEHRESWRNVEKPEDTPIPIGLYDAVQRLEQALGREQESADDRSIGLKDSERRLSNALDEFDYETGDKASLARARRLIEDATSVLKGEPTPAERGVARDLKEAHLVIQAIEYLSHHGSKGDCADPGIVLEIINRESSAASLQLYELLETPSEEDAS